MNKITVVGWAIVGWAERSEAQQNNSPVGWAERSEAQQNNPPKKKRPT